VLCFSDNSFHLIARSAVLHHILDYPAFLGTIFRLLKPSGKEVFACAVLYGYLLPCLMLAIAAADLDLSDTNLKRPEYGLCRFIIDDISRRVKNEGNLARSSTSNRRA